MNFGCSRSSVRDPDWGWRTATMVDSETGSTLTRAASALVPTQHVALQTENSVPISEQRWAWAYWRDYTMPALVADRAGFAFDGYVWSWVQNWRTGTTPPTTLTDVTDEFYAPLRQGATRVRVLESTNAQKPAPPCYLVAASFIRNPFASWNGFGDANIIININGPDPIPFVQYAAGFKPRTGELGDSLPAVESSVVSSLRSGADEFVPVADAPFWARGFAVGALVDRSTRTVSRSLINSGGQLAPSSFLDQRQANTARGATVPTPPRPLVSTASGARQELVMFGEPPRAGTLLDPKGEWHGMRVVNLQTEQERDVPFLSGVVPSAVVAATYRAEDDAYYVLDVVGSRAQPDDNDDNDDDDADEDDDSARRSRRVSRSPNRPIVRLLRIKIGAQVEEIVHWRMRHPSVKIALTTSAEGALVVSTSRQGKYRIAVLGFNPDHSLLAPQMLRGTGAVDLGAYLSRDGRLGLTLVNSANQRYFQARTLREGRVARLGGVDKCF
jgi:hypothetical protein